MPILNEHADDVVRCMKCGSCMATCPVYTLTQRESMLARGRIRLLRAVMDGEIEFTDGVQTALFTCLNCDACSLTCPPGVPVNEIILAAKAALVRSGKTLPEAQTRIRDGIGGESNPFNQPRAERGAWLPPELRTPRPARYLFFAGCSISYASSRTGKAVLRILQGAGVDFTTLGNAENCCGDPLFRMGDLDNAEALVAANKARFRELGVEYVVTPCAGCFKSFKEHYTDTVKPLHALQLMAQLLDEGKLRFAKPLPKKVVYVDGCDIGRHSGVYEEPRRVLTAIPGLALMELPKNRQNAVCCGGPLIGSYPDYARRIAAEKAIEAQALGAEMLAVACPTCLLNLKEGAKAAGVRMDIQDVTALALRALE